MLPSAESIVHILERLPDPVVLTDPFGIIEWTNPAAEEQLGHHLADWEGNSVLEVIHPDDLDVAISAFAPISEGHEGESGPLLSIRIRHGDGSWVPIEIRGRAVMVDGDRRMVIIARNVLDRHRIAMDGGDPILLRALIHHSSAVLILLDRQFRVRRANGELTRLLGHDVFWTEGRELLSLVAPQDHERVRDCLNKLDPLNGQGLVEADFLSNRNDPVRLSLTISDLRQDEIVDGILISGVDVTKLRQTEAALRKMAEIDALTGLLNRSTLLQRIHTLSEGTQSVPIAVLFCDLDGFKAVNDQLGHGAGDLVLQEVAARLQRCVHTDDLLARLGGDEFVVVLQDCDREGAETVAERIQEAIEASFLPQGNLVQLGMSVGIASADEWSSVEPLLASADAAMYEVKRKRKR